MRATSFPGLVFAFENTESFAEKMLSGRSLAKKTLAQVNASALYEEYR